MITARCGTLSLSYRGPRHSLSSACQIVVMLTVLVLALRGYPPEALSSFILVLVGVVGTVDRLAGIQGARAVATLPAP
ncbi:MAG: hypothetical protein ACRDR6_11155 [Pseudonocardiaceae bacterium]